MDDACPAQAVDDWGLGFGVWGLWFRVQELKFRATHRVGFTCIVVVRYAVDEIACGRAQQLLGAVHQAAVKVVVEGPYADTGGGDA